MKRTLICLFSLLFFSTVLVHAQLKEGEAAMVYYMPYTQLVVEIEYEEITAERGMFYQYSERYLATKDIVLENGVSYALKNVNIKTRTIADSSRVYTIPMKVINSCSLAINDKGILEGINLEDNATAPTVKSEPKNRCGHQGCGHRAASLAIPLLEDQLLSGSISKMAEGTAKQIYAIRENRLNILSGDVEHTPADGKAMEIVLKGLDQQEEALTELFVGKKTIKTIKRTIVVDIEENLKDNVLFRFSKHEGVVDADDMSGEPYLITINTHERAYKESTKKDKPEFSYFYQNMPGSADITISANDKVLIEKKIAVAQLGIAVPISQDIILKKGAQVRFNTKTGAVTQIK